MIQASFWSCDIPPHAPSSPIAGRLFGRTVAELLAPRHKHKQRKAEREGATLVEKASKIAPLQTPASEESFPKHPDADPVHPLPFCGTSSNINNPSERNAYHNHGSNGGAGGGSSSGSGGRDDNRKTKGSGNVNANVNANANGGSRVGGTSGSSDSTMTGHASNQDLSPIWSGLETPGMREARCSLLLQEDCNFDPRIKALPKQRVLVYQDKGYNPVLAAQNTPTNGGLVSGSNDENFYVDFNGCTILQLDPAPGTSQRTMPITLTVGGRCLFTPENFQDFRVMMRTRDQSQEMNIAPNGNFDWPDVNALLICPLCKNRAEIPREGDDYEHEYWLLFYPLLQITIMKGSQMTLGTRTVCRLTCLDCMEDLLTGMTLKVRPASMEGRRPKLSFTLPANEVLAEAGSASFLEDGPPRPETHPHVDDILDAWTLYNLWEHSGAWEALQNDYRVVLSQSMHSGNGPLPSSLLCRETVEPKLKDRLGKPCSNGACEKIHGKKDANGEIIRLSFHCKDCRMEHYCSRTCREADKEAHRPDCLLHQEEKQERRERKSKQVACVTCKKWSSYTIMKKCSRCRSATYCSVECQRQDWDRHKKECQKRR